VTPVDRVAAPPTVRLAEVLAAVSLASDVGHDQPLEKSLRNAVIAARLGDELGLSRSERSAAYYVALLRSMGCTGNSHETAVLFGGDDRAFLGLVQELAGGDGLEWARGAAAHVAAAAPELAAQRTPEWFLSAGRLAGRNAGAAACEVSTTLARRLGLSEEVQAGLDQVYERWDGRGPGSVGGEDLCVSARIAHVVDVVEIADRAGGVAAARELIRRRTGSHFDPQIAGAFDRCASDLLAGLDDIDVLEAALDAEPTPQPRCERAELEGLARAIADFADLKSTWTLGHSPAVAELAAAAAPREEDRETLLLAGLLHDLGRVAVPNGIWDRPKSLVAAQWERVRLHSYYTDRILSRTPVFAGLAPVAAAHHERVDGSGYHRGVGGDALSDEMRILAVADAYVAMCNDRPHRAALTEVAACRQLHAAVDAGLLCGHAVACVLAAAGQERAPAPAPPCGLTEREVEVLGLLAHGMTNKEIAGKLFLSAKTVQHHVAHIYDKIDRRTRAGAAMFAMEHRLVSAA
jgi:HD-GYP domain-containing protein (c-di-GMP phosphodiesterase class II)/DNA-binding CsgD family transcriptional regulator